MRIIGGREKQENEYKMGNKDKGGMKYSIPIACNGSPKITEIKQTFWNTPIIGDTEPTYKRECPIFKITINPFIAKTWETICPFCNTKISFIVKGPIRGYTDEERKENIRSDIVGFGIYWVIGTLIVLFFCVARDSYHPLLFPVVSVLYILFLLGTSVSFKRGLEKGKLKSMECELHEHFQTNRIPIVLHCIAFEEIIFPEDYKQRNETVFVSAKELGLE